MWLVTYVQERCEHPLRLLRGPQAGLGVRGERGAVAGLDVKAARSPTPHEASWFGQTDLMGYPGDANIQARSNLATSTARPPAGVRYSSSTRATGKPVDTAIASAYALAWEA